MNTGRRIFIGGLALVGLLAVFLAEEHYRGKWELERWVKEMKARGEKFKIEDLIMPPPATEDNSFFALLQAGSQFGANSQVSLMMPPAMRLVMPGKFTLASSLTEWEGSQFAGGQSKTTKVNWKSFAEELRQIADPLREVREALKKPAFDANLDYRIGFNLLVPDLAGLKGIASALSAAALNELHANNLEAALENLEAVVALSRCLKDERLVISQLVRYAISAIAFNTTVQALYIALKRYELHHGKPAPSLAALVPEILPELPRDLMDRQPLHYQLTSDGDFVLYSVGTDGRDDGGDPNPLPGLSGAIHRLWNGRDIVWPKPATPEEIAAAAAKVPRKKEK